MPGKYQGLRDFREISEKCQENAREMVGICQRGKCQRDFRESAGRCMGEARNIFKDMFGIYQGDFSESEAIPKQVRLGGGI